MEFLTNCFFFLGGGGWGVFFFGRLFLFLRGFLFYSFSWCLFEAGKRLVL